jgi:prophage tail gpP-like protein
VPRTVKPGAACRLVLDGETVVDGWIDSVEANYDERDHKLTVVARDRIGDLVDCAAVVAGAHEWRGLRLPEIAARLAEPYGVRVIAEVDGGAPFPRFAIQPGETAWEALDRAARARGVLLAGDGTGLLRLTRASLAGPAAGVIEMGQNVRRCTGTFDHSQRFSEVVIRGQTDGEALGRGLFDVSNPAAPVVAEGANEVLTARGQGRATDAAILRRRPRVVISEAAGEGPSFQDRASWECRSAAGRGTRIAYVLPGWRGSFGRLWRTNTLVQVIDAYLGVEEQLLVCGVVYSLTAGDGSLTEVEVTLPDAYDVQEVPLEGAAPGRPGRRAAAARGNGLLLNRAACGRCGPRKAANEPVRARPLPGADAAPHFHGDRPRGAARGG